MAPRTQIKENHNQSPSESESKEKTTSRSSTKARNQLLQQQQQEYLQKHINKDGPHFKETPHALDFESLSSEQLRNYKKKFGLNCPENFTMNGFLLSSEIGKKSYSYKNRDRISKSELAGNVKKHFMNFNGRENEIITNFLYKVKNQDKEFKLSLNN